MAAPVGESVFLEAASFFLVDDVVATAAYYRDKLGFTPGPFFGNPPGFVIVKRNTARMMFRQAPEGARPAPRPNAERMRHTLDVYIWVSDVDSLAEELRRCGADILSAPEDSESEGRREMMVRDLNGYHLCFGRALGWPD